MFYRLKEQFLLRGYERLPHALIDSRTGKAVFLREKEMNVLKLCDGTVDFDLPLIPDSWRELVQEVEKHGVAEPCERGEGISEKQKYRLYPARYIETAHWSITGKCNYRCRHCCMSAPEARLGELPHETIMDFIRQMEECGIMRVSLTGGEPLVRSDFMEIVDALLAAGIRITQIYSNGKLVTDKLLDQLEARGIHPEFNMSFDGVGWHDWLRGIDGAEKIVQEAFLRCRDRGFPTGAEMCIHERNKDTLRESVNALASWGCSSLKTNPVDDSGMWKENGYGTSISRKELNQLYLDYIPHYFEDGMPLFLHLGGFFVGDPKDAEHYWIPAKKNCTQPEKTCVCGHARHVMYISPEGRTLPCFSLAETEEAKDFPLIQEKGLAGCISDSHYMRFIDTRVTEYMERNPECAACEYAMDCIGGCRASAMGTSGDLMGPDLATCEVFKGGWVTKIEEAASAAVKAWLPKER